MKTIPYEVKSAVNAYLLAKSNAEYHRERVDKIQRHLLTTADYHVDPRLSDRRHPGFEIIRDPKLTYLLRDDEFKDYYLDLRHALEKDGYEIKPIDDPERPYSYECPALVAESLRTETEHLVIKAAAEMLGETGDFIHKLLCSGLDKYHQFIDLVVKMVVCSPGFKNPLTGKPV